jgi:hypothetical protein
VAVGREKDEACLRAGNQEFDPALLFTKGLIGTDFETEFSVNNFREAS